MPFSGCRETRPEAAVTPEALEDGLCVRLDNRMIRYLRDRPSGFGFQRLLNDGLVGGQLPIHLIEPQRRAFRRTVVLAKPSAQVSVPDKPQSPRGKQLRPRRLPDQGGNPGRIVVECSEKPLRLGDRRRWARERCLEIPAPIDQVLASRDLRREGGRVGLEILDQHGQVCRLHFPSVQVSDPPVGGEGDEHSGDDDRELRRTPCTPLRLEAHGYPSAVDAL